MLTNYHVVAGANTITGTVGGRDYPADLVGYDRKHDIAVLQLRGAGGLPTAPIGDSNRLSSANRQSDSAMLVASAPRSPTRPGR